MFKSRHRAAFAAVVCACVFSACDDSPKKAEGPAPVAPTKAPATKTATIGADMVAAVASSQASSAIGVHFALRATPTVNAALPVDVTIVPHRDFDSLTVHFDSQDGLAVTTGSPFGPKTGIASEVPQMHQLVLLPTKEGMFTVSATVDTDSAEGNLTRVFSIPVIVIAAPDAIPAAAPAAPAEPAEPAGN
jgi:hypothetical protein